MAGLRRTAHMLDIRGERAEYRVERCVAGGGRMLRDETAEFVTDGFALVEQCGDPVGVGLCESVDGATGIGAGWQSLYFVSEGVLHRELSLQVDGDSSCQGRWQAGGSPLGRED